ncbi:hypothetical protein BDZ89DRAFT_1151869 [Hymenopellis radicata]|nr:hypothetical protein BDZ89DRAFT_1151869 [Hymenopellis radicata]
MTLCPLGSFMIIHLVRLGPTNALESRINVKGKLGARSSSSLRYNATSLRKLPPLPTWVKGNVALLGDAAHAMFPTYGQGFAVGLEDAGTIATLFSSGTKASEIGSRLKAFEEIRKPRAEHVSQMSTDAYKPPDEDSLDGSFAGWLVPEFLGYDAVAVAD